MKKGWKYTGIVLALSILAGCSDGNNPVSASPDEDFVFSAQFLYAFFIFQERLPPDPFAFASPQELYASVNEPFTNYIPPTEARSFFERLDTEEAGIGVFIDSVGSGVLIEEVFAGSPAEEAGIRENDTIIAINGEGVAGASFRRLSELLSGQAGDQIDLRIKRGDEILSIQVEIDVFLSPSVFVDSLDSDIAYIRILSFFSRTSARQGTAQEFREALQQTSWARSTILDLRQNPGGELEQAYAVADELLPDKAPIIQLTERAVTSNGTQVTTRDTIVRATSGGAGIGRDIVVLMDNRTASASELVISALRTNRPSLVTVGTKTFGKARGQVLQFTPDSALVRVTYGLFEPVNGSPYDQVGISPDVSVGATGASLDAAVSQAQEGLAKRSPVSVYVLNRIRWAHRSYRPQTREPLGYRWSKDYYSAD